MSDLISRSALLEAGSAKKINEAVEGWNELPSNAKAACIRLARENKKLVMAAPAVDAVDVDKAMTWLEGYTMTDTEKIYSNGTVFVPLYRVKQAFVDKAYNGLREG